MKRFFVEVRVVVPVEAPSNDTAERIAKAKINALVDEMKGASVIDARAVERTTR